MVTFAVTGERRYSDAVLKADIIQFANNSRLVLAPTEQREAAVGRAETARREPHLRLATRGTTETNAPESRGGAATEVREARPVSQARGVLEATAGLSRCLR